MPPPLVVVVNFETWYSGYLQTYLEKDIRFIYEIGSLREFQKFLQVLATTCGQLLNYNNISRDLGVSVNTIKKWVSILEASQIIYLLSPYYKNLGKRINKTPKVYFLDCGLVCYLTGIRDKRHLLSGPMAGTLWENYVISETIKRYYNCGKRPNIYYLRTQNNLEVDLIVENENGLFPVEIKLTQTPNLAMAKQIERFKKIFTKFNVAKGRIISLSEENINLTNNVSLETLDKFLYWLSQKLK